MDDTNNTSLHSRKNVKNAEKLTAKTEDDEVNNIKDKMDPDRKKYENDVDSQKLPANIKLIIEKKFFRLFMWEMYFGYIFWTIFFGIGPMVMFFPMVKLAIDGYEILILSLASPIIMGSTFISTIIENRTGKMIIRLLVISSLLSFQIEEPVLRLLLLSFGTCVTMLDLCSSLNSKYYCYRSIVVWALTYSFFFFLSARVCFSSLIPAWSGVIANLVHFLIGLVVLFDQFIRDSTMTQLLTSLEYPIFSGNNPTIKPLRVSSHDTPSQPNWLLTGIGFGCLLFNLHWVFGELSVVSRWASHTFPNQAPDPIPYSLLVWVFLFCGVLLIKRPYIVTNRWWASVGFISYFVLYFGRGLFSFVGGLGLAVFIGSIIPLLFDKVTRGSSARIIVVASLIYILQVVYAVWTSAYNFVPFGGTLTRETSYVLVFFNFLGIYLGVFTASVFCSSTIESVI
ncbi:unnamed protein product [Didymodactylos carnosus]|uniref:Uncharacterized protein n=1 Tax=Didymodactylos carnosus TaxID=1234261 RepID=A0A814UK68_9BILA|nr:unnamed protein product [Didymodactylos carnosus]CAF3939983.1 unnamed protein product [Didymodactylos carnosus]